MSIRTRLLTLALLATLVPLLLALLRFAQERRHDIEDDTARLAFIAQRRAETINEKLQATSQLLFGLARAGDLQTADRAACSAFLSRVRARYPQYTGLLTIKPDGSLFCDSLNTGRELDLRDRGYFKAALATREQVVMEPTFGRLTGLAVVQTALAARNAQGEVQFVLLASLNLQKLVEMSLLPVPGIELLFIDRSGRVMARAGQAGVGVAPGESLAGSEVFKFIDAQKAPATQALIGSDGQPRLWAMADPATLARPGLHVLASAPESVLLAATNRRFSEDIALLVMTALALFLAVWSLAERGIRRPVARLTAVAHRLRGGDLGARIAAPLPRGELGTLMSVLNDAAASLQQQRTDIDSLNNRLRQSQRLEAMGQLTGGVAHDFNNLLTVVLGNAELLVELNHNQPQQRQLAEMIGAAAQRAAALTQQLLAFARKQALDPKPVDLNQLVAGLDPMLRRTLGEHIEIELIRGAGLWPALIDQAQMEAALLNLCLNARDAMPGGGRLTLEASNARLDADYTDRHADVLPGQYVMLAVSDTGAGIAPEHIEQVFQPFFTTKEKGKGTGLGLAMVYGFVKQSAGHVSIYSELGHGTTVKLYLPRAIVVGAAGAVATEPAAGPADGGLGGNETILLVEDDALVRRYASEQLQLLGYHVIEAEQGAQALAVVQARDDIDLLFTDVVMPGGMNGRALADATRALRPALRVLYTSGYTENAIVHHGRLDPGVQLLAKPYRRAELARAVRAALALALVQNK